LDPNRTHVALADLRASPIKQKAVYHNKCDEQTDSFGLARHTLYN